MESEKDSFLTVATYEGNILVIDVMIVSGTITTYVFGASSTLYRDTMPSYQAQWHAIQYAKQTGSTQYNFGGIATAQTPHKSWAGLTAFKQRFGGHEHTHSPFYDIRIQPVWYWLYLIRKLLQR